MTPCWSLPLMLLLHLFLTNVIICKCQIKNNRLLNYKFLWLEILYEWLPHYCNNNCECIYYSPKKAKKNNNNEENKRNRNEKGHRNRALLTWTGSFVEEHEHFDKNIPICIVQHMKWILSACIYFCRGMLLLKLWWWRWRSLTPAHTTLPSHRTASQ